MQLCKQLSLPARQPSLPLRNRGSRSGQSIRDVVAASGSQDEVYIGFPKNDYAPREGRKGRVIKDDPKKYPAKEDMGFLVGLTGGWAGGEAALVKYKESIKKELAETPTAKPTSKKVSPPPPADGGDKIYVGFGKDEFDLRNSGAKGRVIYDDATKYPAKEDVGIWAGATGGFAGGERGVKGFVATGDVKIRKAGEPGGQPMSPLTTAFLVLVAGMGAAAVVSNFYTGEGGTSVEGFELNILVGGLALVTVSGALLLSRFLQQQPR